MKKIFTLFAALAMVMSMSAVPYLKGSFNDWGGGNSLASGSTTVTLNANATYEFKVNDGNSWYGNGGTMTSTNCTDWTMSTSDGNNCQIKTTIAGVYTFKWNASSKKLSVVYPTEAVEINYYITGTGNLVGGDGWKANEIKMTNNNGTYTHTFTALAAGNYEMKITQGNWENTLGFSSLATAYVGVTGNNDGNIVMALTETTDLIVTVSGTTVSLNLPEKTNTVYFVNEKSWTKVSAYVWDVDPYKPWPGEEMTKVEGKTFNGKDVYTYTFPAKNTNIIFSQNGADKTGDLKYNESKIYYYNNTWNATIEYDKPKYNVTVTAENGTVTGDGTYVQGATATLTATPNDHYVFVNWTVDGVEKSTESTYSFTVEQDVEVVANFALDTHVVTVTAENGEVTGLAEGGKYTHGTQATLTATANEGYEFVNWTKNDVEVSTETTYTFPVTENVTLVANFKKKVSIITETYTLSADAADTNHGGQWYVEVPGEEEAKYQIIIPGYEGPGTYEEVTWRVNMNGEWTAMSATVTVTYDEENNLDVYVISATTEDSSTIYNVTLNVDHKEAEEKPEAAIIPLESYMPKVTKITEDWGDETEPWLVTSYIWTNGAYDPIEFNLTVTLAAGLAPSLEGYIDETFVIGVENEVLAGEEEGYAILRAQATDGTNTYTIELMAELTTEEEGGTRAITVIEAEIYPNSDNKTDLDIYGWSDTDEEVTVTLLEGTSKLYGEYTDDLNVYIGGWNQYYLAEETTATFALVDGLAVFNATVVNGNDTVVLTISGAPWVNPKDIVPTDTVNHTIVDGTIEVKFNMFLNISGSSDDISVNISTTNKTTTSEDIENCSSAYVEIDDEQINLLRGQFEIVTVGDVKIAYIGALGADHKWYNIIVTTGSEAPTALDNLGTTVAPVKVIVNGQLIITKDGVQYNAQGAVVK